MTEYTPIPVESPRLEDVLDDSRAGIESVYDGSISSSVFNFFSGYYRNHYENENY